MSNASNGSNRSSTRGRRQTRSSTDRDDRFAAWMRAGAPGGDRSVVATAKRINRRMLNDATFEGAAAREALRAFRQLETFIRADGSFDRTAFKNYKGKGYAIPGSNDGQRQR